MRTETCTAPSRGVPELQIERGVMWVFEQPQSLGFSNVTTNVRMVVIKLASGGLWVHAPIAPTKQCLELLKVGREALDGLFSELAIEGG